MAIYYFNFAKSRSTFNNYVYCFECDNILRKKGASTLYKICAVLFFVKLGSTGDHFLEVTAETGVHSKARR